MHLVGFTIETSQFLCTCIKISRITNVLIMKNPVTLPILWREYSCLLFLGSCADNKLPYKTWGESLMAVISCTLTFRHRASCILGLAFHYSPDNAFYTGCNRRNVRDFGRVFLSTNFTDITQNTYIESWTITEILAREVWNFDSYYSLIDYQIHIETGRNMWFL